MQFGAMGLVRFGGAALVWTLVSACGGARGELSATDASSDAGGLTSARVNWCHDGDTCNVTLGGGDELTVRLGGIDAPEVTGGDDNRGQPYGREARDYLNQRVRGHDVKVRRIEADPYGRTIGELYEDGKLVNIELVERGFAEAYKWATNAVDKSAYRAAEGRARDAERGVWSLDDYESPSEFRKRTK